ncbi:MAG: hypothetical protein ACOYEJ_07740 [Mahellales bacterium]|jgi:hypothetical protein
MAQKRDLWHNILYWVDKKLSLMLVFMLCALIILQGLLTIDEIRHKLNYEAKLQNEKFDNSLSLYSSGNITISTDAPGSDAFLLLNGSKYCPLSTQTKIEVSEGDVLHLDGRISNRGFFAYITTSSNINDRYIKSQVYVQGKLVPIGRIKYK